VAVRKDTYTTLSKIYSIQIQKRTYTVKIGWWFSRPQPGCHLPNSPCLSGNNQIIPDQEEFRY
jgi:hypothetical protein